MRRSNWLDATEQQQRMTDDEYGGVHTMERRSGIDRRSSNWRDAVEAQRADRVARYDALLAALDALVNAIERLAQPSCGPDDTPRMRELVAQQELVYARCAEMLKKVLAKHREGR